jgi:hypothetical protein
MRRIYSYLLADYNRICKSISHEEKMFLCNVGNCFDELPEDQRLLQGLQLLEMYERLIPWYRRPWVWIKSIL